MASLGDLVIRVGANVDGFEKAMGDVSKTLNAIDRDANKAFSGFEKIGDRLTSIGTSLTAAVTLPLAGAGIAATKMAADFELAMRQVTSLLGRSSTQEFEALRDRTLELSKTLGIDAVKAAQALYEAISAGVPKENALDFIAVASKAAIAGLTDTNVAVDALTTIIAAYSLEFTDAKKVSDAMFQAVNVGKFRFEELAASIGPAAAQASNLGISYEELLAATATLSITSGGVSIAVTQIESAMRSLLNPTKEMEAGLRAIGFETGSAAVKTLGFEGTLEALRKSTHGSAEDFNALFGRIEGASGALGLTGPRAQQAAKDLDILRNSTGAADLAFQQIDKTTSRQFERLTNELKGTAIELGTALLPAVNNLLKASEPLVQALANVTKWFTALSPEVQTTVLAVIGATAAIGPLVVGLGITISAIAQASAAIATLSTAMGVLTTTQIPALAGAFAALKGAVVLTAGVVLGWNIGAWAYEHIPGVKALGDAFADLLLKIPLAEAALFKLTGVTKAQDTASASLEAATKKLEQSLAAKGVTVDNTGLSTEEYAKRLRDAAKDLGLFRKETEDVTKEQKKSSKEQEEAARQADASAKALREYNDALKFHKEHLIRLTPEQIKYTAKLREAEDATYRAKFAAQEFERDVEFGAIADEVDELSRALRDTADEADYLKRLAVPAFEQAIPQAIAASMAGTDKFKEALKSLGISAHKDLQTIADEAAKARDVVLGSNLATDFEKKTAVYRALKAQVEAAIAAGQEVSKAQIELLNKLENEINPRIPELKKPWESFGKEVSTIITNTAQDMARALFDGDLSFGEKMKTMLKSIGQAVIASFIQPATEAIATFISGVLTDLISGRGFGAVLDRVKDIGTAIADIFTGISGGAGQAAGGAAGAAGGAAGGAGGAAGQAASGAATGALGIINAISGVATAISSVVQAFQLHGIGNDTGRIEEHTRYARGALLDPGGVIDTMYKWMPYGSFILDYLYRVQLDMLGQINDALRYILVDELQSIKTAIGSTAAMQIDTLRGFAERRPNVYVTVEGNIWREGDLVDLIARRVAENLKTDGVVG